MKILEIIPARKKIEGIITIPGSKSYTNRALIIASLAKGKSLLKGVSSSDDSNALVRALEKLGIKIKVSKNNITVIGRRGRFLPYKGEIDVGAAGTTMRFLTALCALAKDSEIILKGSKKMHERPIKDLVEALKQLGVKIDYLGKNGCPPLKIRGTTNFLTNKVAVKGTVSSQYFSSLLMIGPALPKGLKIKVRGEQISKSYIDMTIASMNDFGVLVKNRYYREYKIDSGQSYQTKTYPIEGDASGAAYFWAIAAVSGGKIKVKNIYPSSAQGDVKFPNLLQKMGCRIRKNIRQNWIEIEGSVKLKGIRANMDLMPDSAQTLAVVAAFAQGETRIEGLSTLRVKETDRLTALHKELLKMGIKNQIGQDYIIVEGGQPHKANIETYKDHRMAMAFAVAGTKIPGIKICDPAVVSKSFPEFWEKLKSLNIKLKEL